MPLRSVIDIDVNDDTFKAFQSLFDRYAAAVDRLPGQWKQAGQAIAEQRSTFVAIASALMAQNEILHKGGREVTEIDRTLTRTQRTMRGLSRATREFAGHLTTATATLMRWTGVTGVVGALTGLLSAEGVAHLARSAAGTYRTTLGYAGGTTPAQVGAADAFRGIMSPSAVLSGISEMLTTAEGKRGLVSLGFGAETNGASAGTLLPEFLRRLQRTARAIPGEANFGDIMSGMGLGQFTQLGLTLRHMRPGQLEDLIKVYAESTRELGRITERVLEKWVKFDAAIGLAGTKIQSAFVVGLEPLLPKFTQIVDVFSNAIVAFGQSREVSEWMDQLADALKKVDLVKFAVEVEHGAEVVVSLAKAMTSLLGSVGNLVSWVNKTTGADQPTYQGGAWSGGLTGGALGAVGGGLVAGPPGAVVGGLIGFLSGAYHGAQRYEWQPVPQKPLFTLFPWQKRAMEEYERYQRDLEEKRAPGEKYMESRRRWSFTSLPGAPSAITPAAQGVWYTGSASAHEAEGSGFNVAGIRHPTGGFRTYPDAYAGVADMGDILKKYGARGEDTLEKIISKWAPPTDSNPTDLLIERASKWTGFERGQKLDLNDPQTLRKVMIAMNRNEFGGRDTMDKEALDSYISGHGRQRPSAGSVGLASQWIGATATDPRLRQYLREVSHVDPATTAWCAAFANAMLAKQGIKGSGSNVATSFMNWGKDIGPDDIQANDVLVLPRGHAAGETGGHVGFATGRREGGRVEMISGNLRHQVATSWENIDDVVARRSASTPQVANEDDQPQRVTVRRPSGIRVTVEHDTGGSPSNAAAQVAQ